MKKYWLEAAASFLVVGLGQIIKGDGNKGLILLLLFYFALPGLVLTALLFSGPFFLVSLSLAFALAFLIWLFSVFDALFK